MVNGLRQMYAAGRRKEIWRKLLSGTLATVLVMAALRLLVVPLNTLPSNWASRPFEIPAYRAVQQILGAIPGKHLVIVRYRPDHFWAYSWINNSYDIPGQQVIWARDTEPEESNRQLLCIFKDRQAWLLIPPERGYVPPPDRTAGWDAAAARGFLAPYPKGRALACDKP
jgi:hypothetical protein